MRDVRIGRDFQVKPYVAGISGRGAKAAGHSTLRVASEVRSVPQFRGQPGLKKASTKAARAGHGLPTAA